MEPTISVMKPEGFPDKGALAGDGLEADTEAMGKPPPGEVGFEAPPDLVAGRRWAEVFMAVDFQVVVSMEEVASTEAEVPTAADIAKK